MEYLVWKKYPSKLLPLHWRRILFLSDIFRHILSSWKIFLCEGPAPAQIFFAFDTRQTVASHIAAVKHHKYDRILCCFFHHFMITSFLIIFYFKYVFVAWFCRTTLIRTLIRTIYTEAIVNVQLNKILAQCVLKYRDFTVHKNSVFVPLLYVTIEFMITEITDRFYNKSPNIKENR